MTNRSQKNNSQLNQFLNEYANALIALILVLFLLAAYWFVLSPKLEEIQSALQSSVGETQKLYNDSQRKLANLKLINEGYKKISPADLQKFNSVLPDEYKPERLFGELEEIISRGGWFISDIGLTPIEEAKPALLEASTSSSPALVGTQKLSAIKINLTVAAIDYNGLKSLLKMLENNLRLFDITNVTFSPSDNDASLVLTTYYYKAPK